MKLDVRVLRYMSSDEIRVLTATEMGSKNHEVVPTSLISNIAGLRHGGVNKILGELAKRNLVAKVQNTAYDGYRLTYGGYDYLALRALSRKESVYSIGNQIGVGKESDIYVVADEDGTQNVLKIHRLGRISFRKIKQKRDYMGKRKSASWMYMSRLAATKEFAFMKILHQHGFPVPRAIDQVRHCIIMSLLDATPLKNVSKVLDPGKLYSDLMDLIVKLASYGLVHGDFNEFNILVKDDGTPILIDFPQMVSTSHLNAEYYFNRDVDCIRTFFKRKFDYESLLYPKFSTHGSRGDGCFDLDVEVAASGYSLTKEQAEELRKYFEEAQAESDEKSDQEGDDLSEEEVSIAQFPSEDEDSDGNSETEKQPQSDVIVSKTLRTKTSDANGHLEDGDEDDRPNQASEDDLNDLAVSLSKSHVESFAPSLSKSDHDSRKQNDDIKDRVSRDLKKSRAKQKAKHHSKSGQYGPGRAKGNKAKKDSRRAIVDNGQFD